MITEFLSQTLKKTSSRIRAFSCGRKKAGTRSSAFLYPALILILAAVISSCNLPSPQQLPGEPTPDLNLVKTQVIMEYEASATPTPEPTATEIPTPTPTPKKVETLTICLGK